MRHQDAPPSLQHCILIVDPGRESERAERANNDSRAITSDAPGRHSIANCTELTSEQLGVAELLRPEFELACLTSDYTISFGLANE